MKVNHSVNSANVNSTESSALKKARETFKSKAAETIQKSDAASESSSSEISTRAKEMAMAKQVALDAPDVREEKIAELRRRIANREYNVKPEDIADRLVDEHMKSQGMG